MSDREPSRWQHNRIYPYPINPCVYTYDSRLYCCETVILSTPHSTLHVFDWGFLSVECESFHTLRFLIQIHGSDAGV